MNVVCFNTYHRREAKAQPAETEHNLTGLVRASVFSMWQLGRYTPETRGQAIDSLKAEMQAAHAKAVADSRDDLLRTAIRLSGENEALRALNAKLMASPVAFRGYSIVVTLAFLASLVGHILRSAL